MKCPKCKTVELRATKLEDGLLAHGCSDCNGVFVSLLYYRDWAERTRYGLQEEGIATPQDSFSNIEADDSVTALTCPKCARLMRKFKVSGNHTNRLDLCTSCDEAWLDGGEWELLKALALSHEMPKVFTEEWQKRVRKQTLDNERGARFERLVGTAERAKAEEVRDWLKDHPHRQEILFYLNHE